MIITDFSCKNYRNLNNINTSFCNSMNVICGENAQGKTNLLEAIWMSTGAKSFRNSKDVSFIKFNEQKAFTIINFISNNIKNDIKIEYTEKRQAILNENKLKSPYLLAGKFNAIVFSPIDLSIISDGPQVRRKFLDTAIGQIYPSYINNLKNYIRAIGQRNKIIKDFKYDSSLSILLDSFENEIAENGKKIINIRIKYLNLLNTFLPYIYNDLSSGKEILETEYIKSCDADNLKDNLEVARKIDIYTGTTSLGPHRDDIKFKINSINSRSFASQGQKRSIALAIKLSEAEVINKITGEYPIFLLDDVMSELDPQRQNYILNHIKDIQSIITCCDPQNVKNLKAGKIINIKNGSVVI